MTTDRIPPHDTWAEVVAIGSMLLEVSKAPAVRAILKAADFYTPANGEIFRAICDLMDAQQPVDLVTLRAELTRRGRLEAVGGVDYLVMLADDVPSAANAEYYAGIVKDKAKLREMISFGLDLAARAYGQEDPGQLIQEAQQRIYAIGQRSGARRPVMLHEAAGNVLATAEKVSRGEIPPATPTGFADLDVPIVGFRPGQLIVLAADTSKGKSALALNIAENIAEAGGRVLFVSGEMSEEENAQRYLQDRGNVPGILINHAKGLRPEHWEALQEAAGRSQGLKLALLYGLDGVAGIVCHARQLALQWGGPLDLLVVDYLQLFPDPRAQNDQERIANVAWSLKAAAVDLECPVMLLSQFNRFGKQERPGKHHLLGSGAIENHASIILLLYHPAQGEDERQGVVWLKVDKCRNGMTTPWPDEPRGESNGIRLIWKPVYTRFETYTGVDT